MTSREAGPKVLVFDVNETLSDMSPMGQRFEDVGVPAPVAKAWFAGLLRDGQIAPERIARYALLDVGGDGMLRRIVEKPDAAAERTLHDAPVSMNCSLLTPAIFGACRAVAPSPRGELELPLAIQYAIDKMGMRVRVLPVDAPVLDLSHRADIPAVASRLARLTVNL